MKKYLETLGLNPKETEVYLYLIEYGISAASEISQHIQIPKSSVNFLADNLWKKGILKKSFKGKTGYYEADVSVLENTIQEDILKKEEALDRLLPLLKEKNKNVISKPKISFIDGIDQCKKAYLELLTVKIFYEFGAHHDLEEAFGKVFMQDFIQKRVEKNIFCDSIGSDGSVEIDLQEMDESHNRELQTFSQEEFGKITSSIAIYGENVLILNLQGSYTGVHIHNSAFSDTMKTIFLIAKRKK